MKFETFCENLEKIEQTASRLEITSIFSEILKGASLSEMAPICYLTQGRIGPKFEPIEFQIAEKMWVRAISIAFKTEASKINELYKKLGDMGDVAQNLAGHKKDQAKTVKEVFNLLRKVAETNGTGSQEAKVAILASLLSDLGPIGVRYLVRIPLGKLRLGLSDVTVLDSLSQMLSGNKSHREELERAYNVCADLGMIAEIAKESGISGINKVQIQVGVPIRCAQSERLGSLEAIVEKLEKFAVEPKYDGFRVQIHLDKTRKMPESEELSIFGTQSPKPLITIFSRNHENITNSFPDIVEAVSKLPVKKAIIDGEAIAFNSDTDEFLSFQETVQRRRKHKIAEYQESIPLKVFVFDLLYLEGEDLLASKFQDRFEKLEKIINKSDQDDIVITPHEIVGDVERARELYTLYVTEGLEGIMCKKLDSDYQAGSRNYNWIKYKRVESGLLQDTIDGVVMGYYKGKGKRTDFGIGAFLIGVIDPKTSEIYSIARVGTGVTDVQFHELKKLFDTWKTQEKPKEYLATASLECDIWIKPQIVVEVKADEITKSPMHMAKLALRFPRLIKIREKSPDDATTLKEVNELFKLQPMH